MKAHVISIGTELTTGQSVDTNSAWLSGQLAALGIAVEAHATIDDELEPIRLAIERATEAADLVLINGGLGPTEDDLTRQAMAAAMGVPLELHQPSLERIKTIFLMFQRRMPESNRVQAMVPVGAEVIENSCGTAPGMRARLNGADVFVMPGVPREMKVMFERTVLGHLAKITGGRVILSKVIRTYGAGESSVAEKITDLMKRGRNPLVGTTAQETVIGVRIVARGETRQEAERLIEADAGEIRRRLGTLVFGQEDDTLEQAVGALLAAKGETLATAESCTGGMLASRLTDVPGSSRYFLDGVVVYSNEAKTRLLEVAPELIAEHGAVSEAVAEAMAVNCRRISAADHALSVTGIAGPTGGTPEKPIGLIYVGLAGAEGCKVREYRLGDHWTRNEIRDRVVKIALNLLRLKLIG